MSLITTANVLLRSTDAQAGPHLHRGPQGLPPAAEACAARDLCVVLHDVSPARWEACQRVLAHARQVAEDCGVALPLTLLVVPRMHDDCTMPARYLRWLHRMAAQGHELALHGLTHRDEGPPARSLREHLLRRHYTAGEGEFAALAHDEAAAHLAQGQAWACLLYTSDAADE